MVIKKQKIQNWKDTPIIDNSNEKPYPLNPDLPKMFFSAAVYGASFSGKSVATANLIQQYLNSGIYDPKYKKKCAIRIIIISPTPLEANLCFKNLKNYGDSEKIDGPEYFAEYSEDLLKTIIDEIDYQNLLVEEWENDEKTYKNILKKIGKVNPLYGIDWAIDSLLSDDEINVLQRHHSKNLPRFNSRIVTFLILDDLVGSKAYSASRQNYLTQFSTKYRHHLVNMLNLAQTIQNGIPRTVRLNTSLIMVFLFADMKTLMKNICDSASSILSSDNFETLYKAAIDGNPHNFFLVDNRGDVGKKFRKNFDTYINIE